MARRHGAPASLVHPPQPPDPPACSEAGCDWRAAYRDGANSSLPYCIRHGPFASVCPTCGGGEVWIDLGDRTHCSTCTPKPSLTTQISAVLADINADDDLRASGPAIDLRRVLGVAQRAEKEFTETEKALPAAEQAITKAQQRAAEALAAPHDARQSLAARRDAGERLRQQLTDATEAERDLRTSRNVAGAARDDAQRRAAVAVGELARLRAALAEIRAKSADVAQARRLARILGRT
jgi:hypothetical protein